VDITGDDEEDPEMAAALEASRLTAQPMNEVVEVADGDSTTSQGGDEGNEPKSSGSTGGDFEVFAEPLRMSKYLCPHGKLDPIKTQYLKVCA